MLKIKDNVCLEEIVEKYNLRYDGNSDYYDEKSGIFIDDDNKKITGFENSTLELLYDLIYEGYVEKVEENVKN